MKHRIRAAGIALQNNKILMLRVRDQYSGEYWIPPGGGLEDSDVSSKQALVREFREETGLDVTVGPLLCVREFHETSSDRYHVELFYLVESWRGELSLVNLEGLNDSEYIQQVAWVDVENLNHYKVFPADIVSTVLPLIQAKQFATHLGSYVQGENDEVNHLD
ncbi:NUDIX domain-containing protein [Vibrio mediterranei]|jgi:ADP-ribose pyrophosphatase YjhB (NUDIX family)|nr:NUDIX domain-containing protein [Vibrio mediterranei]